MAKIISAVDAQLRDGLLIFLIGVVLGILIVFIFQLIKYKIDSSSNKNEKTNGKASERNQYNNLSNGSVIDGYAGCDEETVAVITAAIMQVYTNDAGVALPFRIRNIKKIN